ncbi:MAG TPA: Ig-like domain-containing protein, partial [Humisphaera sp.]
ALANGVATFATSGLSLGGHAITAAYAGGGNFAAGTSDPLAQMVTAPAGCGVTCGSAAGPCYWAGCTGQRLIEAFNGGSRSTRLGNWLAATFPNLYGPAAGAANNLAGATNAQVADYVSGLAQRTSTRLAAELVSTALSVYATSSGLGGQAGASYGFRVSAAGLAGQTWNVGSGGGAFGVASYSVQTVFRLLLNANARSSSGTLFGGNATYQSQAYNVVGDINQAG